MKEDALGYIQSSINDPEGKFSLFAEPTVICYGNEKDPHLILAIGAVTNNTGQFAENRYTIIDIDATESEIAKVADDLEKAVKSLTILPQITDSLELEAEKTENGTILRGNVKLSPSQVIRDLRRPNILTSTSDGLFSYVGLRYDEDEGVLTFMVNDKETSFKIADEYVVGGEYKHEDESIHLYKKSGDEIIISCTDLLDEWVVEGENTKSPVVLKKEAVVYGTTSDTSSTHALPWQDVLSADVRLSNSQFNILRKTEDKRSLEVEGVASNIAYFSNGQQITVKDALDELSTNKLSNDSNNLLYKKLDGFFASVKLRYVGNENALYFTTSNIDGSEHEEKISLNRVELFKDVTYDPTTESLKITYVDNLGSVQICSVPIGKMLRDWEWQVQSEGHTIALNKERNISGDDILTADVKITSLADNILQDIDHALYVKGTANNIKYNATLSVEDAINTINESLAESKETEKVLDKKIDTVESNLTSDLRDTERKLNDKIDGVEANLTEHFGKTDEKIKELEETKLNSIENKRLSDGTVDNSIEISTKDDKLAPQINVRLSKNELNIIRTTADGVEAEVGLGYNPVTNVLTFTTSSADGNKSVEYKLNTTSFVDDIKYDSGREEIVIRYHSAGGETQEVRVPVRDIINEIDFNNTSTVKFTRTVNPNRGSDIVAADVVISPSLDNALSNVNGLFVSKSHFDDKINANTNEIANTKTNLASEIERATNAEAINATAITNEIARAKDAEKTLQTNVTAVANDLATETNRAKAAEEAISKSANGIGDRTSALESGLQSTNANLASEILRSQNKDTELAEKLDSTVEKIDKEISRAVAKDESLTTDLNNEKARAIAKEGQLEASFNNTFGSFTNTIDSEVSRAIAAENAISLNLEAEKNRATTAEQEIKDSIANEVTKLENADARLESSLNDAKTQIDNLKASTNITYEDTTTVTLAKDANNVVRANAKVANANENIISLDSTLSGLYARVDLAYNAATNVLTLTTTNDKTEIKLNSASVLQSAQLDNEKNELVLTFQLTDGSISTTRIPIGTLFNTWKPENQATNSAIELTKIDANPNTGVNYDILKARVLVSASDKNMLRIDGNSLFVDKSEVTAATENVTTLKNEVKKLETAFIGVPLEDGGGNYAYASDKPFISASTSWTAAIEILADQLEDATNLLKNRHYVRVITDGEAIKHPDSKYINDNLELRNALTDDTTAENNGYGNVSFKLDSTAEGNVWLSADVKIVECGDYEGEYRE